MISTLQHTVLTAVSAVWHILVHEFGPVEQRHEKMILALGYGSRPRDAVYESRTLCRIRARYRDQQQQSSDADIAHCLQTVGTMR